MSTKSRKPKKTASGAVVHTNVHRTAAAQELLVEFSYSATRDALMKQFGISKATAERDIADAKVLIAEQAEKRRPYLGADWTQRLTRVADKAEDKGEYQAVVSASREVAKINGLYAEKKIKITNTTTVSMQVFTVVGILDAEGLAALEIVQRQIESARAQGLLPVAVDESKEPDPEDEPS